MTIDAEFHVWIQALADSEELAAQRLWEQYFEKLVRLARRKLDRMPRRVVDEEDVALSALKSFVRGVEHGRFPQLNDRDDLWRILLVITARKATAQRKRHLAKKRGGGHTRGESAFLKADGEESDEGIGQVLGQSPTAELQTMFTEQCEQLLGELEDPELRVVALCKLEGYTNEEIANVFSTTTHTVERWLRRIRKAWEKKA